MQFLKNIIVITPLFMVALASAKGVPTSATQPKVQPSPQPMPRVQPQPMPQPIIQPQFGVLTYSEILSELKKKTPDSGDFSSLNNIKNEAERQMQIIPMVEYAGQLVNKYYKAFNIDQQRINNAIKNNSDIFPNDVAAEQLKNIDFIVREFAQKYPNAEKNVATQVIRTAIFYTPSLQKLRNQLSKNVNKYEQIRGEIQTAISETWDEYTK